MWETQDARSENRAIRTIILITIFLVSGLLIITPSLDMVSGALYVGHDSTYQSIQDAIDDSIPGDTITINGGNYDENLTVDIDRITIRTNSTEIVNITGSNLRIDGNSSTLMGLNLISCKASVTGDGVTMHNITFSNIEGHALSTRDCRRTKIRENSFTNITGTAVHARNSSSMEIHFCDFRSQDIGLDFQNGSDMLIEKSNFVMGNHDRGIFVNGSNTLIVNDSTFDQRARSLSMAFGNTSVILIKNTSFDVNGTGAILDHCSDIEFDNNVLDIRGHTSSGVDSTDSSRISFSNTSVQIYSSSHIYRLSDNDNISIIDSDFLVDGNFSLGPTMEGCSYIYVNNNRFNINGYGGTGLQMKRCDSVNISSNTYDLSAFSSTGPHVENSRKLHLVSNYIGIRGDESLGTELEGKNFMISDNDVKITAPHSTGFNLGLENSSFSKNMINISEFRGFGVVSNSRMVLIKDSELNLRHPDSRGFIINGTGRSHYFKNVTIEITGEESMGIISDSDVAYLDLEEVDIRSGSVTPSIYVDKSSLNIKDSIIETQTEGIVMVDNHGLVENCTINSSIGLFLINSTLEVNRSIITSVHYSIDASSDSNVGVHNTVYDKLRSDSTSSIEVYNTRSLKLVDVDGNPVPGVEMMVENKGQKLYSTPYFNGSDPVTDGEGNSGEVHPLFGIWTDSKKHIIPTNVTFHLEGTAATWEKTYLINTSEPGMETIEVPDIDKPMTPDNLTIRPVQTEERLFLQWNPNTDDTTEYRIHSFLIDEQVWEQVDIVSHPQTSWTSPILGQNATGIYRIKAFDGKYESEFTAPVLSNTLDLTEPDPPTGLSVSSKGTDYLVISWTPPADEDIEGYEIEINRSSGFTFYKIGEVSGQETEYNITGLTWGTEYKIRVRAFDRVPNFSDYSQEISNSTRLPRFSIIANVTYGEEGPVSGMKAEGATVILRFFNGIEVTQGTTDPNGTVEFSGINPDLYVLEVQPPSEYLGVEEEKSGYLPVDDIQVEVNFTHQTHSEKVVLTYYQAPQQGTVSVSVSYQGGPMDGEAASGATIDLLDDGGILYKRQNTSSAGRTTFNIEIIPFRGRFLVKPPDYLRGSEGSESGYLPETTNFFLVDGSEPDFGTVGVVMEYYTYIQPPAPLRILSYVPTGLVSNLSQPITIIFNQAVNVSTIETALKITPALNEMELIWSDGDSVLTIEHAKMIPDQEYVVNITNVARSSKGTGFPEDYTDNKWTFQTFTFEGDGEGDDEGIEATTLYIIIAAVAIVLVVILFVIFRRPDDAEDLEEEFFDEYEEDFGESEGGEFDDEFYDDELEEEGFEEEEYEEAPEEEELEEEEMIEEDLEEEDIAEDDIEEEEDDIPEEEDTKEPEDEDDIEEEVEEENGDEEKDEDQKKGKKKRRKRAKKIPLKDLR